MNFSSEYMRQLEVNLINYIFQKYLKISRPLYTSGVLINEVDGFCLTHGRIHITEQV